ncbi:MAG TPA: peptidylprolyl isomerase [Egibacteraceae bacterium]|nr:peptidylprolyl isomerase [Actinomycetota bacterium]HWB71895.1 peptidylprolyl isomerase [Egibacteraceae bacterium]
MSGKQAKREKRRAKEAARQAARRRQQRETIATVIVIAIVVAIGGVLIWVSVEEPQPAAEPASEEPTETAAAPCEPEPPPETAGQPKRPLPGGPAQVLQPGADYRTVVETSCGTVVADLYEDRAPQAVNSFVFLAQQGFFDGLEVFRNAPSIFALQTGAGDNQNTWDVGYTFPDELAAAQEEGYPPGSLALANSGPNTNGSQFFFVYGHSSLPPQYVKFGQAVEGLEVLQRIGAIPVEGETPTREVYLESVTIQSGPPAPAGGPTEPGPGRPATESSGG